jgi:predicted transcriptional regulator
MKLQTIVDKIGLRLLCCEKKLEQEITGGYASDLLSNVIARSKKGDVWVTMMSHANIIAVAVLKDLGGIIITEGREPDPETIKKAAEEQIPLMLTTLSTFQVVGKLYEMGIHPGS